MLTHITNSYFLFHQIIIIIIDAHTHNPPTANATTAISCHICALYNSTPVTIMQIPNNAIAVITKGIFLVAIPTIYTRTATTPMAATTIAIFIFSSPLLLFWRNLYRCLTRDIARTSIFHCYVSCCGTPAIVDHQKRIHLSRSHILIFLITYHCNSMIIIVSICNRKHTRISTVNLFLQSWICPHIVTVSSAWRITKSLLPRPFHQVIIFINWQSPFLCIANITRISLIFSLCFIPLFNYI